jgi:predicted nuclease with TOPRIM domain
MGNIISFCQNNDKNIIKELEKQKQELKDELRKKNTEISNLENKIDLLENKHKNYKDNISKIFEDNLASEILKQDGLNLSFLEDSVELAHIDKVTKYIHSKLQEIV